MRRLTLALLALAPAVLVPGVAHADHEPGHEGPTPPAIIDVPDDYLYPVYAVCYDLAPAGELPRRACYEFQASTGELLDPEGQVFTYDPPGCGSSCVFPEPIEPYTPREYVAPGGNDPSNDDDPLGPYPTPAPVQPVEREPIVEQAVRDTTPGQGDPMSVGTGPETCVPNASRGMPGFDPILDDDNDGVSCEQASNLPMADEANEADPLDPTLVTVATVAALVLLLAVTLPLAQKRRARHAAE